MSTSNIIIGLLVLALAVSLYWVNSYRKEAQELRTELVIERNNLELALSELGAVKKASAQRRAAQEEIDNETARRNKTLDSLPSDWSDSPLPSECFGLFRFDSTAPACPDSPSGGSHATD